MKRPVKFKFRLYVAGDGQNGALAISHLTALCRRYLPNRHEIEIVDVYRDPKRALEDGVLMTPTLMKLAPAPLRRIVGALSQERVVLQTLGLRANDA
jgi:circadian clock protein KaiB